jgi:hypothetical protein
MTLLAVVIILQVFVAAILQICFSIGSSQALTVISTSQIIGLIYAYITKNREQGDVVRLSTYLLAESLPVLVGSEIFFGVLDFFVPLVRNYFATYNFLLMCYVDRAYW